MGGKTLFRIGAVGTVIAAICCFTPVLPIVLGAIGLGGLTGLIYSDAVLIPVLLLFLALGGFGLWLTRRQN